MPFMKIGIFDSGLGGLFVLKSLVRELPQYDYVYLGDTQRMPYGNRSHETVYDFLEESIEFLFKSDCRLVIVACNTASAEALPQIQQRYMPIHYPKCKILGVIVPTVEEALKDKRIRRIGVLATQGTVDSEAFVNEIKKVDTHIRVFQQAAPLLVPLIENDGIKWAQPILKQYLKPLLQKNVETIILGCTHYPILKKAIKHLSGVRVISQDELIPKKLVNYLERHPEIKAELTENHTRCFFVTDVTKALTKQAKKWFGKEVILKKVRI
jgi:glutamate racemase